jgi:hypothetical protein
MSDSKQPEQISGQFLVDSGLLYIINREILHPVGLALTVTNNGAILLKSALDNPEIMVFNRETVIAGYAKFKKFMASLGNQNMDIRKEKLGWTTQSQIYGE